jgi:ADP-heptose:LPS heptosyltransferase
MKILLVRFSSIGDIVLTSPVARCIATQVSGAEVHFATKAAFADLVRFDPHVTRVHAFTGDGGALVRQLKRERFDLVVDLHASLRSRRYGWYLGRPTVRVQKHSTERWLRTAMRVDRLPRTHVVDRALHTVAHLGVRNDGRGLSVHIPPERALAALATIPPSHAVGYTALAIGAAHATKRLSAERLAALAALIEGPLVLVGGPTDRPVATDLCRVLGARAHDAVGRHDLLGSAAVLRAARVVVAHDSAAMHMAAAFSRPLVSIWGCTVPEFGMGPYLPMNPDRSVIAQVDGLPCRPCCTIGKRSCPRGDFACMERQDLDAIAAAVRRVGASAQSAVLMPEVHGAVAARRTVAIVDPPTPS